MASSTWASVGMLTVPTRRPSQGEVTSKVASPVVLRPASQKAVGAAEFGTVIPALPKWWSGAWSSVSGSVSAPCLHGRGGAAGWRLSEP